MYETLTCEIHQGVATLTLNRPERLNAISPTMATELATVCRTLSADETLRALVVTGRGRAFCAGADIEALEGLDGAAAQWAFLETVQHAMNAVEALPVPSIAAINGVALGGGCELAIACDFRIMSDASRLGVPEIKLGLLPGAGGTQRLSRLLPPAIAKQMIYLGDPLGAGDAHAHGIVNAVVPADEVLGTAMSWAGRIADLPPLALRTAKLLVHGAALNGLDNGIEAERQGVAFLFQTSDAKEGIKAFLEKREPRFQGN